jgi:hypothetical protein
MAQAHSGRNRRPANLAGAGTVPPARRWTTADQRDAVITMAARVAPKDGLPRYDPVELTVIVLGVAALTLLAVML